MQAMSAHSPRTCIRLLHATSKTHADLQKLIWQTWWHKYSANDAAVRTGTLMDELLVQDATVLYMHVMIWCSSQVGYASHATHTCYQETRDKAASCSALLTSCLGIPAAAAQCCLPQRSGRCHDRCAGLQTCSRRHSHALHNTHGRWTAPALCTGWYTPSSLHSQRLFCMGFLIDSYACAIRHSVAVFLKVACSTRCVQIRTAVTSLLCFLPGCKA